MNLIILKGICQVLKKLNEVKPRRILSARIPKIREEFICSSYSNNLKFRYILFLSINKYFSIEPKVDTGLSLKRGKTATYKRDMTPLHVNI